MGGRVFALLKKEKRKARKRLLRGLEGGRHALRKSGGTAIAGVRAPGSSRL